MPELTWQGKAQVKLHHLDVPFHLLNKQYDFHAAAGSPDNRSDNILIHGDNLLALKSLLPEFGGKINCIYIDPPYNTGEEKWVYNDNVNDPRIKKWLGEVVGKEGEDFSRHDKWLCMMYPRLKLLKQLLAEDGVIFISIDDNEQACLKLICDEIFGGGFIGCFVHNKLNSKNDRTNIQKNHEYILVYYKRNSSSPIDIVSVANDKIKEVFEENGEFFYLNDTITTRGDGGELNARPNLGYTIYYNPETKKSIAVVDYDVERAKISNHLNEIYTDDFNLINQGFIPIRPPQVRGKLGCWTWSLEKFNSNNKNILIKETKNSYRVHKRTFVEKRNVESIGNSLVYRMTNRINARSILEFSSSNGVLVLNEIMGQRGVFKYPKNVSMIEYLICLIDNPNALILDSFSGSGTTAHAVLSLNQKDGGNRRFIGVEMMDYAENITAERIRRVINGYGTKPETQNGTGGGFSFYTVGEPLFQDDNLNPKAPLCAIRKYIGYTEGLKDIWHTDNGVSPHALGYQNGTAYVFYYEPHTTALSWDFLNTLNAEGLSEKPEQWVIYADTNVLTDEQLKQSNIIFKRIPRDISGL